MSDSKFELFEKSIHNHFLVPKDIPKTKKLLAFYNFINGNPTTISTKKKKIIQSLSKALTDDEIKKTNNQKMENIHRPKDIKFGQHSDESFFEKLAREIVFQLFDYQLIGYYNYKIPKPKEVEENEEIKKLYNTYIKKYTNKMSQKNKEKNTNYLLIKNLMEKQKNKENKKKKELSEILINNENSKKISKSDDESLKIENKTQLFNLKYENLTCKSDIDNNKKRNQENKKSVEISVKNESSKDTNKGYKTDDKNNKLLKNPEVFIGDFDFVLPNISTSKILQVINNNDTSPFLFYGNIDLSNKNENFDIIGEIKENLDDHKDNIVQLGKYIEIFYYLQNSEKMNKNIGLTKKNKKILMYVFNSSYKKYLMKMIEHKIHFNKFKEIDKEYRNEYYEKIVEEHKEPTSKSSILIDFLINSKIPYIVLFIQDPAYIYSSNRNEINELKKK